MATAAEKARRKARGAKIKSELRRRQAAGDTGTKAGKFTPSQVQQVTAPPPAPSAPRQMIDTNMMRLPEQPVAEAMPQAGVSPTGAPSPGLAQLQSDVIKQAVMAGIVKTGIAGVVVAGIAAAGVYGLGLLGAKTAVAAAAKVGTAGISLDAIAKTGYGTASAIASNSATAVITTSWISRLATGAVRNPLVVASAIVGAIGSYPFAGFIKEEALQTTGFAVRTAAANDDIQGAEDAIALQKEILDPSVWKGMLAAVPYANVLSSLEDFYKAARLKVTVDEKMVADMKVQIETGETDDAKWERVKQEEADQYKANVDYYNAERQKLLQWEFEMRSNKRDEDAAFWRKERAKQRELEEADRIAIMEFWLAYRKEIYKMQEENRPSKLNFGIV